MHDLVVGFQETMAVPAPPMVAEAGPSIVVVESAVKWLPASVVVLWQTVHAYP